MEDPQCRLSINFLGHQYRRDFSDSFSALLRAALLGQTLDNDPVPDPLV